MRRVVITGMGVVTPLGNDLKKTWAALKMGQSGIGSITKFDASGLPVRIAGELKDFSPEAYIPRKDILRLDPFIHYAIAAAIMAVEDAGLLLVRSSEIKNKDSSLVTRHSSLDSAGVIIGSSRGGIISMEKALGENILKGKPFSAYLMASSTINMASSCISMRFGLKGPALAISTACASGANAIGEAARLIRSGEMDIAFAGGAEAPLCRLAVGGYGASGALSTRNNEPEQASRPFDIRRDGFVIAEGAGVLILEELQHALRRGAKIYAELSGYGISSDAFHQTRPDPQGEGLAIKKALQDAGVSINDVDYINAHGTSTPIGDRVETEAIKEVFGDRAYNIPVSSTKSMLGHMLGGAGAVEAAITAMSISSGIILPTINMEYPDPDCDLDYVCRTRNKEINTAISNSFGFGGVNAVLVLRKFNLK
ncbi:MAG: beta-ketoacyl-ACP synthase II [Nitrospirae bacterium]|nr:beta-ketoacyl-ACP synthase II [Nitrospirota bacterium]